ncbi:MAG TPA: alpha/beta fold hydrolase [Mesorhizobium sp.]|nr:alpha/beta fold hydrolase [Mesorhizobium sp.]
MAEILLVHGAWHGPWCWIDFAERLRNRGHQVQAVRLRGHDRPRGRIWHRVHHYVEDVGRAAADFAASPVLVGHSLGGLVVQKYLERNPAAGAVLMASIPTNGTIAAVARLLQQYPVPWLKANLLLRLQPLVATRRMVRELFFTPDTPQAVVDDCFERLQDESYLAFIDTMVVLPRPRRVRAPMLVLGAGKDAFFTVDEVRRTALAYGTEAEIFPEMAHDMMLDRDWCKVADRIDAWVRSLVDNKSDASIN